MWQKIKPYVVSILIPVAVGGLAALLTRGSMDIYGDLIQPPLSPPAILFPIVWTILYILMGVSAAMIYTNRNKKGAITAKSLRTYGASLLVNFFWSILFFNFRAFLFSFIWLLLLLFLIIRTIVLYHRIKPAAAYLQIPYALWVTFAGYLNFAIWLLNK